MLGRGLILWLTQAPKTIEIGNARMLKNPIPKHQEMIAEANQAKARVVTKSLSAIDIYQSQNTSTLHFSHSTPITMNETMTSG